MTKRKPKPIPRRTHSLAEVAAAVLPPDWTDGARWLSRRLNRGEIPGTKYGRSWRMTDADVEALIARYRNHPEEPPVAAPEPMPPPRSEQQDSAASASDDHVVVVDFTAGMSPVSLRRLRTRPYTTAKEGNTQ